MTAWTYDYTRDEVQERVADALAIVAATEPPDDLRQAAFSFALNALSAKRAHQAQAVPVSLDQLIRGS